MLKVDRTSVPIPSNLQNLTQAQKDHLADYKKISNSIYAHNDVKYSLQQLYGDKCYICECRVGDSYAVEHFLPKQYFSHLGYTWENLHKVCSQCNLAKESNCFLIKDPNDDKKVTDILLLDPSSPSYNIYDYITSDINGKVVLQDRGSDPLLKTKAITVMNYLNGQLKKNKNSYFQHSINVVGERKDRLLSFERTISMTHSSIRENCVNINASDNYIAQVNNAAKQLDQETFIFLSKLENIYLNKHAEYSSFLRNCTIYSLRLTYEDIIKVINLLKKLYNY